MNRPIDSGRSRLHPWLLLPLATALVLLPGRLPGEEPAAREARVPVRIRSLQVTVLSTMLADTKGIGEWGFAALVEADGHRLLFDTGARPETVLDNARELGVELADIIDVVLSHHHGDHTGGLLTLRRELAKRTPGAVPGLRRPRHFPAPARVTTGASQRDDRLEGSRTRRSGGTFVEVAKPTGDLPRRLADRAGAPHATPSGTGAARAGSGRPRAWSRTRSPRTCRLVLDTEQGLVVVSGCGHAGVVNTLEYARKTVRAGPVHAVARRAPPVRGRRTDARLDGGQAPRHGAAAPAGGPLHRDRGGLRPAGDGWAWTGAPAWSARSGRASTSKEGIRPGTIAR